MLILPLSRHEAPTVKQLVLLGTVLAPPRKKTKGGKKKEETLLFLEDVKVPNE